MVRRPDPVPGWQRPGHVDGDPPIRRSSAGILLFKQSDGELQVLLAHPGGPFWRHRDDGAWSIPKGELAPGEPAEIAARREFAEETGATPEGDLQSLGTVRQRGGKQVEAFALEGDFDVASLHSNAFEMEWPPRSGRLRSFPEIDRVQWFGLPVARRRILGGQLPFVDRLVALLQERAPG